MLVSVINVAGSVVVSCIHCRSAAICVVLLSDTGNRKYTSKCCKLNHYKKHLYIDFCTHNKKHIHWPWCICDMLMRADNVGLTLYWLGPVKQAKARRVLVTALAINSRFCFCSELLRRYYHLLFLFSSSLLTRSQPPASHNSSILFASGLRSSETRSRTQTNPCIHIRTLRFGVDFEKPQSIPWTL